MDYQQEYNTLESMEELKTHVQHVDVSKLLLNHLGENNTQLDIWMKITVGPIRAFDWGEYS